MTALLVFLLLFEVIQHETPLHEQPFVEKTVPQYCGSLPQKELSPDPDAWRDSVVNHDLLPPGYRVEIKGSECQR